MPDRQADEGALRVVIYGGSNSFMGGGYVSFLKDELARLSGREIAIENNSMGNTFVHFGLYVASRFAAFADADVVVVEYAINDQELLNHRCEPFWRSGYEGLLRKIRAGNPRALLCSLILYPEGRFVIDKEWKLANEIKGLTAAYGGFSLDVAEELRRCFPDEIADIRSVYRNGTHYAKRFQSVIAALLAEAVAGQLGASPGTPPAACVAPRDYSGCVTLGEGIAGRIGGSFEPRLYENSRSSERTLSVEEGGKLEFHLRGEIICIVYAATRQDGLLRLRWRDQSLVFSTYRRAFTDGDAHKWGFLISNVLPAQARRAPVVTSDYERVELEPLPAGWTPGPGEPEPFMRGSTILPPASDEPRRFNLIDILHTGDIRPGP